MSEDHSFLLTSDELAIIVEALREYRLRLRTGTGRRIVCEALIFRGLKLLTPETHEKTTG